MRMSPPFVVALLGLLFCTAAMTYGELTHSKSAGPLAFLVGGTMMLGGIVIGLMRSLLSKRG